MSKTSFQKLVEELRRRRVFRVATLYVVSIWPILQIIDILSPALNISDGTMRHLLLYFVLGFPIAIIIAWLYNLTPKGLVKNDGNQDAATGPMFGNRLEMAIIFVCVTFAIVLFIFQDKLLEQTQSPPLHTQSIEIETQQYNSIAVLPFVPFSDNKQDEYFADGLAEELLNVLAKIQSLQVAARTSSFAYKGIQHNIQKIGRELGVDVILEGSVRRNDVNNTVRVTAQLIDVRSGSHLWSETYDRKFEDIFKIQDDITQSVVGELKITLLGEQQQQLLAHRTASPEAIMSHTKGREELAKRTGSAIQLAKEYFEDAIRRDSNYSTAYASLAEANILLIEYDNQDRDEYRVLAQEAVEQALSIDPELGLAWAAQGLVYMGDRKTHDKAHQAFEKAIKLNPSYAMAYMWFGSLQDDFFATIKLYEKAYQLDPKSPVAGFNYANSLIMLGRDAEAMDVFSNMIDADPFYPNAYFMVGEINTINGRHDQAIQNFEKSFDLGDRVNSARYLAKIYTDLGDVDKARYWLSQLPENANTATTLTWQRISHFVIEDKWSDAKNELKKLTEPKDDDSIRQQMDAVMANYFLEDFPAVILAYERVSPKISLDYNLVLKYDLLSNMIYAAYAYNQMERSAEVVKLIAQIRDVFKQYTEKGFRVKAEHWYLLGLIEVIEGNSEMAIVSLQRAVDQGWIVQWSMDIEPILRDFMNQPGFQEVRQSLNARMRIIKEQLAYHSKTAAL